MSAQTVRHRNVFTDEAQFLHHYAKSREVARYIGNHIRVRDGIDLLGAPAIGEDGMVVRDAAGKLVWATPPPGGWVPSPTGEWLEIPYLAPYLQSMLIQQEGTTILRVTPEIRIHANPATGADMPVRTLSIEMFLSAPLDSVRERLGEVKASMIPIAKSWYPEQEDLTLEERLAPCAPLDGAQDGTLLLLRYFAREGAALVAP